MLRSILPQIQVQLRILRISNSKPIHYSPLRQKFFTKKLSNISAKLGLVSSTQLILLLNGISYLKEFKMSLARLIFVLFFTNSIPVASLTLFSLYRETKQIVALLNNLLNFEERHEIVGKSSIMGIILKFTLSFFSIWGLVLTFVCAVFSIFEPTSVPFLTSAVSRIFLKNTSQRCFLNMVVYLLAFLLQIWTNFLIVNGLITTALHIVLTSVVCLNTYMKKLQIVSPTVYSQ